MKIVIRIITSVVLLFALSGVNASLLYAQGGQRTVTGRVLDAQGAPIPGAAILFGGAGDLTDKNGAFSIRITQTETSIEVSCLGYVSQVVTIPSKSDSIVVTLQEDALALNETVVVGYGVQKKVDLTGAVSVVSAKDIQNRTSSSLTHMLQGQVPGLTISTSSGNPSNAASINIRGTNSINGGSPLVLIDGADGDLSRINPNDVESISVIKDASSSAVYGARASFGVILVTTKSGGKQDGKPVVRYSGRMGWSNPTTSTDFETRGYDYVYIHNLFWNAWNPSSTFSNYTDDDMRELYARRDDAVENPARPWVTIQSRNGADQYVYYGNYDWYHMMFSDLETQSQHNISVSGGSDHFKYYLSGGYQSSGGTFTATPDKYSKYNLRANLETRLAKWASLSNNTSFFKSSYWYPGVSGVDNVFNLMALSYLPTYPAKNPDGTLVYTNPVKDLPQYHLPILANSAHNDIQYWQFSNKSELTLRPFKDLEIKGNFTYTHLTRASYSRVTAIEYATGPNTTGLITTGGNGLDKLEEVNLRNTHKSANIFATYTKSIQDNHHLKVMAGYNYEDFYSKRVSVTGNNLTSEQLVDIGLVGTNENDMKLLDAAGGQNEYALMGFFGRLNYDYKDKYLFEASARYDGTSRFPAGQRWGFFPSASIGWKLSEEGFFQPIRSWFNLAKIRFSYGSLGNQQVGYYDYVRTISQPSMDYYFTADSDAGNKTMTAAISNPVAGNLTWEKSVHYNLGLDLSFLGNRLGFTGEAYIRDTKDMLTEGAALPSVYGADAPETNAADLRTKGYELSLSWRDGFTLLSKPFNYGITATFNDYVSHITKYDNPTRTFARDYYEGYQFGEIWGFVTDGYFSSDDEAANYAVNQNYLNAQITGGWKAGDLKFRDLDGDGIIGIGENTVDKPGDRKILGNALPRYQYGLTMNASWMGFDLSLFFQGVGKQNWYPPTNAGVFWGPYTRPYQSFIPRGFMDLCWTEENPNPDAYFPRARGYVALGETRELGAVNDRYLQNIGYIRLKNLTIGYTLPQTLTRKVSIESVRFYFTGENLWYDSPLKRVNKYIDPEEAAVNVARVFTYRWQKTFMFGIDVTF